MEKNFGKTGEFPKGKLNKDDEGEIRMGVAADRKNNVVILQFGTPVAWLGLPAKTARMLGASLIKRANELEAEAPTVTS